MDDCALVRNWPPFYTQPLVVKLTERGGGRIAQLTFHLLLTSHMEGEGGGEGL